MFEMKLQKKRWILVGGDNGVAFDKVGVILSLFFHGVGQAT
jgi:hypothetical protein